MAVKQLAVFVENAPGRLKAVVKVLADAQVNMRAISLADTSDFGVIRMIVSDNEKALDVLEAQHFTAKLSDILAVKVGDAPGQLLNLLGEFEQRGINIEYMYAFKIGQADSALMLFKLDQQEAAEALLREKGHHVLTTQQEVMETI